MAHPARLHVSLEPLPPEQRFQYWCDQGSLYFRPALLHPDDRLGFHMHGTMASLGPLVLVRCGGSRQIYRRDPRTIASDGVDFLLLDSLLEGCGSAWHNDRHCALEPGDLLLNDLTQPSRFELEAHERITASIPRALLAEAFPEFEGFHGSLIPRSSPCAQALLAHLEHLDRMVECSKPQEAEALARGLVQLVALYFRSAVPNWERAQPEQAGDDAEQLLSTILGYVDAHLSDPDLSVNNLVAQFKLSRTALYRLFEPHGGVAEVIRERRLQYAYRLLLRPQPAAGRQPLIRDLALGLGFSSEAHFSRVFKARFGLTARAVRQQQNRPTQAPPSTGLQDIEANEAQIQYYYQVWAEGLRTPALPTRPEPALKAKQKPRGN